MQFIYAMKYYFAVKTRTSWILWENG
jgi:hypothetical protein